MVPSERSKCKAFGTSAVNFNSVRLRLQDGGAIRYSYSELRTADSGSRLDFWGLAHDSGFALRLQA